MRVQVVDPSAYTPPYDHALCRALGMAGVDVELVTSRFAYGPVASADRYVRRELFYRAALGAPGGRVRMASKLVQHVPDMLRYRRLSRHADVVHFQWLTVQQLDARLLPAARSAVGGARKGRSAGPPLVLTAHDVLPREPRPGQLVAQRRLYDRFDAIVVHSEHGRNRLIEELGVAGDRVHVIPHGVFTHLAEGVPGALLATPGAREHGSSETVDSRARAQGRESTHSGSHSGSDHHAGGHSPVVLLFGLMRPYKGIDVLLDAWHGAQGESPIENAQLWIAGMPKMDISALQAHAPANVRFFPRFITDDELPAYFEAADLVVLPYLQADQSGVLFTALAFGKPLLLSDVGGFPEMAGTGAARIVPARDARALGRALRELLADTAALSEMSTSARAAADGRYSWEAIAGAHIELYEQLLQGAQRR